jgi:hypothetical protein
MIRTENAAQAWMGQYGGTFSFLIAAHMTFSRVFDDYFDDPADDSSQLLLTASRRLADAAAALDAAEPLPDLTAQRLLGAILNRVREIVALAPDASRGIDVAHLRSRTDADLVRLADRLRALD